MNSCVRQLFGATTLAVRMAAVVFVAATSVRADEDSESRHEAEKPSTIHLGKESLEQAPVKTEDVKLGDLEKTLKVPGRLSLNANKTAVVTTTLEGRIQRLSADINDSLQEGEVVAQLESPELLGKPLLLRAPIGGVVMERSRSIGEIVGKEMPIYTISDPSSLWVIGEVRERDLALVRVGQEATFSVLPYPGRTFRAKIERIGGEVEQKTRTVEVRMSIANGDGALKPGMFADIEIVTTVLENVPLISDAALQTDGEEQIAFVEKGAGEFERRVLRLGAEEGGKVQVLEGLAPGEHVVTEGSFILKSEMLKGELGEE